MQGTGRESGGEGTAGWPQGECTHWDALGDLGNVGCVWAGMKDKLSSGSVFLSL